MFARSVTAYKSVIARACMSLVSALLGCAVGDPAVAASNGGDGVVVPDALLDGLKQHSTAQHEWSVAPWVGHTMNI